MKMLKVAESFQRLASTSSRLAMANILSQLFRASTGAEVDKLIYLLRGRLGPPYEAPDFGVDEKLILWALAKASGMPRDRVERIYKEKGDLGLAAEAILPDAGERLEFLEVYDILSQIALAHGHGAQVRKVDLLAGLLRRSSGPEARFILGMLQGKLRLGVGDATIMDGLSEAAVGDYSLRATIERAYDLCSDLGLVGRITLSQGVSALEKVRPLVGKPVLAALAERLPSPQTVITKLGPVAAEPKYDGLRLQLHKDDRRLRFFTRRLEDVTDMFPDLARAAERQIAAASAILDGEALAYNPESGEYRPFQETVRRKRKYEIEEMGARFPLRYFAFDLLFLNGDDLTQRPLSYRRRKLLEIVKARPDEPIQVTEQIVTGDPQELERFFEDNVERGLEGIVVKRPDSPYQAGKRNFNWVKLKRGYRAELRDTVDLVLVGYLVGKGKRAQFGIGSLLGAVYDPEQDRFRTITKIGSGLTEVGWAEIKERLDRFRTPGPPARVDSIIVPDVWTEPRVVVEVQADEITRSPRHTCGKIGKEPGYALRFPRVVAIRWDKRPEDATTEQEILDMFRMQRAEKAEPTSPRSRKRKPAA